VNRAEAKYAEKLRSGSIGEVQLVAIEHGVVETIRRRGADNWAGESDDAAVRG
jgi:hypothetical protein